MRVFLLNSARAVIASVLLAGVWLSSATAQNSGWPPNASNLWQWSLASVDAATQGTVVIQNIAPLATGHAPLGCVLASGSLLVLRVRNWSSTIAITAITCDWPTRLSGYFAPPAAATLKQPSWPPTFDRIVDIDRGDSTLPPFGLPQATNLGVGDSVDHDLLIFQGPAHSKFVLTDFRFSPGCRAPGLPCWELNLRLVLYERKSDGEEVVLAVLTGPNHAGDMSMHGDGPVVPFLDQGSTLA